MDEWTDEWVMSRWGGKKDFWRSELKQKLSTFKIPHFFSVFFFHWGSCCKIPASHRGTGVMGRVEVMVGLTCPMLISRPSSSMTVFFFFFLILSLHLSLCLWRQRKRRRRRRRSAGGGGAVTLWPSLHAAASPESSAARRHCVLMVITLEPHRRRNNWHFEIEHNSHSLMELFLLRAAAFCWLVS